MNETGRATVGDKIKKGQSQTMRNISIIIGLLVYLMFLIFSAVHNFSLLTTGVRPDLVFWATLGVFTMELSAVGLPLALHFWTFESTHRTWALIFYVVDLLIIIFNIILDFNVNALGGRENIADTWLLFYLDYIAPATPVLPGAMWTVLLLLDPHYRARQIQETVAMATLETIGDYMIEETRGEAIQKIVSEGAAETAKLLVSSTVAAIIRETSGALPDRIIDVLATDVPATAHKHKRMSLFQKMFNKPVAHTNGRNYPLDASSPAADRATGEIGPILADQPAPILQERTGGVKGNPTKPR